MLPHQITKDAEGRPRPEQWSSKSANFALQKIVREEEDKLNSADCARAEAAGVGHLIVQGKYGPELATCYLPEGKETYRVEPIAAQIKHTGLDSKKAVGKRWRAFCSGPQSEATILTDMFTVANVEAEEEAVEPAPAVRLTPAHELLAPPKRGPGRPRKDALAAV